MFGHKKGAFTDAKIDKPGKFELADGGTLFLDEIGETDLNSQVKLLRVLQEQKLERIGDNRTRNIDVRIICATNRNLPQMIANDTFREDLFYRINLINMDLCPLRERASDIALLVEFFIGIFISQYNKPDLSISTEAIQHLTEMPFPGNIRELRNILERVVVVSTSNQLVKEDFIVHANNSIQKNTNEDLPEVGTMTLEEIEEEMVRRALKKYNNNISKAAKSLGLSRQMLYRRMERFGINN
jgi:two-component system NtrC family response regulator